jgi:methylphosphotriester-DNA--protein-cysteine methyltransferase
LNRAPLTERTANPYFLSPNQYLLQARIEGLRELLRMSDVAQNVVFSSQRRLDTALRKSMGMTPARYRNRNRG